MITAKSAGTKMKTLWSGGAYDWRASLIDSGFTFIFNEHIICFGRLIDIICQVMRAKCMICFIQHVQYWKTKGMVYVSDFQGARNLLTDPQIMSSPDFEGKVLFGDGNLGEAFKQFPMQHVCNEFCNWFRLPALMMESLEELPENPTEA